MVLTRDATETKDARDGPSTSTATEHFACVSRNVLMHPPIRHRNAPTKGALSVYEFAIAAAVISLARKALPHLRHEHAMAVGRQELERLRESPPSPDDECSSFKDVGEAWYDDGRAQFDKKPPSTVKVVVRASALLRTAGLSTGGKNLANVPAALDRLRSSARALPAVLKRWARVRSGKLKLVVDTKALPRATFAPVPLPLPTKGSQSLALYLFAHGSDQRSGRKPKSIAAHTLYRWIGIYPEHAKSDLHRALGVVNEHMRKRLNSTVQFELVRLKRKRLRFVAVIPERDEGDEDYEFAKQQRQSRERRIKEAMRAAEHEARDQSWRAHKERLREWAAK